MDTTFGASGKVILDLGGDDEAVAALRVQSDGKIVVAGSMEVSGDRDWLLARFTAAGALDTTFNSVGYVTTDLLGYDDEVHALVIQSDGKIVVGGSARASSSGGRNFALARYTTGGALDTSFSGDGIHTDSGWQETYYDLALQSDGKIVAVGHGDGITGQAIEVDRFTTGGSPDSQFGGKKEFEVGITGLATGVVIDASGRINVAGVKVGGEIVMIRILGGGTLDPSFAGDGIAYFSFGSSADAVHELALMSDGSLLAVGETDNGTDADLALVRAHGDADGGVVYVLHDANFNVTSLIGDNGTDWEVIERFVYDPYGERTVLNADWTVDTDGLSDVVFVHGHQGGRHDLAVGLMDFRNRFLDTSLGRWTRQDPLGYVDGMNLLLSHLANPSSYLDPQGLAIRVMPSEDAAPGYADAVLAALSNLCPCVEFSLEERRSQRKVSAKTKPEYSDLADYCKCMNDNPGCQLLYEVMLLSNTATLKPTDEQMGGAHPHQNKQNRMLPNIGIRWNPDYSGSDHGPTATPVVVFAHELGHAWSYFRGKYRGAQQNGLPIAEQVSVQIENQIGRQLFGDQWVDRTTYMYNGQLLRVDNPTNEVFTECDDDRCTKMKNRSDGDGW